MRIDLHLHTSLSKKNGDSIKWNSTYETLKILYSHKVKMISFTDHNDFSIETYLEAKKLAKNMIVILPGVEINVVKGNGKIAHLLVLFPDNLSIDELNSLKKEVNKIYKKGISINEINDWFSNFETIRIPHVGKSDYFDMVDLEILNFDAIEITNETHQNYLKFLKSNFESSVVAFSDTHMWDDYPQQNNLITDIEDVEELNFEKLKKVLQKNKNFTKKNL